MRDDPQAELLALAQADQADRQNWERLTPAEKDALVRKDRERRARVRTLIDGPGIDSGEALDAAALIFQHGAGPDDFQCAHELATLAATKGRFGSLPALAEDRFLDNIGRLQRFGSQFKAGAPGRWVVAPTDEGYPTSVTDALRADFMVPSLERARQRGGPVMDARSLQPAFDRLMQRHDPKWLAKRAGRPEARLLEKLAARPSPAGRKTVLALYRKDGLATPADYRNAAQTLAAGDSSQERLLAHELATVAVMRGDRPARALFTKTWDAFLSRIGRPSRFGPTGGAPALVRRLFHSTTAIR